MVVVAHVLVKVGVISRVMGIPSTQDSRLVWNCYLGFYCARRVAEVTLPRSYRGLGPGAAQAPGHVPGVL